jgi:predicted nucleotidyltransferase
MYDHHHRVIARLTEQIQADPDYLALLIGGSLVRGWGRPDSDIDVLLLVTPEAYARRKAEDRLLYFDQTICDYEGGYIDGKIIDQTYLEDAATKGIEATRSAFVKTQIAFSRMPELESYIQRITAYPEAGRESRIKSFYSQLLLLQWFVGEAEKRNDAYLMTRTIADLVLFGGRVILAHNRILYPFHKWLMQVLREAPEKPDNFIELTETLLHSPNKANAVAFVDSITQFRDWGVDFTQAVANFTRDREQFWRIFTPSIHDW